MNKPQRKCTRRGVGIRMSLVPFIMEFQSARNRSGNVVFHVASCLGKPEGWMLPNFPEIACPSKHRDHLLWIPQLETMRSPDDLVPFVGSYKPLTYLGVLFLMSIGMLLNSPL